MTTFDRLRVNRWLLLGGALAAGCTVDAGPSRVAVTPALVLGTAAQVGPRAVPDVLDCVSSPLADGATVPNVLRVSIVADAIAGTATATLVRGQQFRGHAGSWQADAAEADVRTLVREGAGAQLVEARAYGGLQIDLERDGAVVRGTLVDDQCYQRVEASLTCWNSLELFGSPWAGVPGLLAARYDWTTGACQDAAGAPALNATPIEVVRETGQAECADLRGVALNGGDLAYPDLDGWLLVGALLDDARLSFASLRGASLQGADLSGLEFGYATVEGFIDGSTVLPGGEDACQVTVSPWAGDSVSCSR